MSQVRILSGAQRVSALNWGFSPGAAMSPQSVPVTEHIRVVRLGGGRPRTRQIEQTIPESRDQLADRKRRGGQVMDKRADIFQGTGMVSTPDVHLQVGE